MRLVLRGKIVLEGSVGRCGKFSVLIHENENVFGKYFGVKIFPGSLNVRVEGLEDLPERLDQGSPKPDFTISKEELINMPEYIGDGQAWKCILQIIRTSDQIKCWVFRRVGSRVRRGIIEVVSELCLVRRYGLKHWDEVIIEILNEMV